MEILKDLIKNGKFMIGEVMSKSKGHMVQKVLLIGENTQSAIFGIEPEELANYSSPDELRDQLVIQSKGEDSWIGLSQFSNLTPAFQ